MTNETIDETIDVTIDEAMELNELDEDELDKVTGGNVTIVLNQETEEKRARNVERNIKKKMCIAHPEQSLNACYYPLQKNGITVGGAGMCPICRWWFAYRVITTNGVLSSACCSAGKSFRDIHL